LDSGTIIKELEFSDFDQFASVVSQADLEHSQLDRGAFFGTLSQICSGPVIMSQHMMNRTILQEGTAILGYTTFLISGEMLEDFYWRRIKLSTYRIGILKGGTEHSAITIPGFIGMPVSIRNDYLIDLSIQLGYPDFFKRIRNMEFVDIKNHMAEQLHLRLSDFLISSILFRS